MFPRNSLRIRLGVSLMAVVIAGLSMSRAEAGPMRSSLPADLDETAAIPAYLLWTVLAAGHAMIFAALPDVATITAAVTGLAMAILGLYVVGVKQITQARIDAAKAWETAQSGSLSGQLATVEDSLAKARQSLHELRNEAQVERLRLQEEISRLTQELHSTRGELGQMRAEYRKLLATMRQTERRGQDNTDRLDRIEGSSSDDNPGLTPSDLL